MLQLDGKTEKRVFMIRKVKDYDTITSHMYGLLFVVILLEMMNRANNCEKMSKIECRYHVCASWKK